MYYYFQFVSDGFVAFRFFREECNKQFRIFVSLLIFQRAASDSPRPRQLRCPPVWTEATGLSQSEASSEVTWLELANQRPAGDLT